MKKLLYLIVIILVLGLIVSGCIPVVPPAEKDEATSLTKVKPERPDVKPGTDFNGRHYNLNLIGKKIDWNDHENFSNPDRHTMFVPLSTEGLSFTVGTFDPLDGIKISMTSGTEFAVIDGTWFDDYECAFQLGPDKYDVYIVAKGKPGGDADITGWVYAKATNEYLFSIGHINVSRSKKWKDITDMFEVDASEDDVPWGDWGITPPTYPMWVFDYLTFLADWLPDYESAEYFWQLVNNNIRLIQVRFYPVD
jgi:hypothetical protein